MCFRESRTVPPARWGSWLLPFAAALIATSTPVVCLATAPFLRSPAIVHDTQLYPIAVAVGDFNLDGIPDVAVAHKEYDVQRAISIHYANSDGSYRFPTNANELKLLEDPQDLVLANLKQDNRPDLVVAAGGSISVFLGASPGPFGPFGSRADYAAGSFVSGVVTADFDGDGIDDVAAADQVSGNVRLFHNPGSGLLTAVGSFPTGGNPTSIAAGDLNDDGHTDVAVTQSSEVAVLFGTGAGFGPPVHLPVAGAARVAIARLDSDTHLDLIVGSATGYGVSVRNGVGDGMFGPEILLYTGINPQGLAVADLDADGDLDVATAGFGCCFNDVSVAAILDNDGAGGFHDARNVPAGQSPGDIATGDLDGDGRQDLVVAQGTFGFAAIPSATAGLADSVDIGGAPRRMRAADMNGDGRPDLIVLDLDHSRVRVLLNDGPPHFGPPSDRDVHTDASDMAVGDVTGDGRPDVVVSNYEQTVSVFPCLPDGSLGPSLDYSAGSGQPSGVAIGDLNNDGLADLALAVCGSAPSYAAVLFNDGEGGFDAPAYPPSAQGCGEQIEIADMDQNGLRDLAVGLSSPFGPQMGMGSYLGGWTNAPVLWAGLYTYSNGIAVADFDNDGRPGIAMSCSRTGGGGPDPPEIRALFVWKGFNSTSAQRYSVGAEPTDVAAGDLTGDGRPDIVVANLNSGTVSALASLSDGTFAQPVNHTTGDRPRALAIADWNGDGHLDVAVGEQYGGDVWFLYGGVGTVDAPGRIPTPRLVLEPAYPNPASSHVRIGFSLPSRQHVALRVFDTLGRRVATLIDRELDPGRHEVGWDRRNESLALAPAGVYFIELFAERERVSIKVVVMK
jgi:FG-GAP-like repeat